MPDPGSVNQSMPRDMLLTYLQAAIATGELKYARRLCTSWLTSYPGDLMVKLAYAQAFLLDQQSELQKHALPILEELCSLDPEDVHAQQLLAEAQQLSGTGNHLLAKACVNALSPTQANRSGKTEFGSTWAKNVREARGAMEKVTAGDYQQIEKAEYFIHKALAENPESPLASVVHMRWMSSMVSMPRQSVHSLAKAYYDRWPGCLQFQLALAHELMEAGQTHQAVEMLHGVVAKDAAGQVSRRLWGENHPYSSLWPSDLSISNSSQSSPLYIPVPDAVTTYLGRNRVSPPITAVEPAAAHSEPVLEQGTHPDTTYDLSRPDVSTNLSRHPIEDQLKNETAQTMHTELERMAEELKRPYLAHEDGRFPIFVIFSTRAGLESQYGVEAFNSIDQKLKKLAAVIHGHRINQEYWGGRLLYADDVSYTTPLGLHPAPGNDPWQLKLLISDLDHALQKRGERIGALLIAGGPEIVPFHHLPNPVEDADADVPSDNPYAARDNNYFISDWQVGRLSGGSSKSPAVLLSMLQAMIDRYDGNAQRADWYQNVVSFIQEMILRGVSKKHSSFGYTAAVWRQASLAVFRSIGNPNDLLVSPPMHSAGTQELGELPGYNSTSLKNDPSHLLLPHAHLAYFNLHGVPDSSEWYGQTDPLLQSDGPDFPIAIQPQDISRSHSKPRLVFTEACYGANIAGKSVDDAISLKFIQSGTEALIGSTCISYGSLSVPLSSADLLGRIFWTHVQEGFTAGEALRRAKIQLTREMNRRQGFLDAEDQKTLISFVLMGDPLTRVFQTKVSPHNRPHLSDTAVPVPTVCEHACEEENSVPVSMETISHLKTIVSQYLPGMNDAEVSLSQEKQSCSPNCKHCASGHPRVPIQAAEKSNPGTQRSTRRVVTLSKNFERSARIHRQYARLTLDERGNVIKMVVSR